MATSAVDDIKNVLKRLSDELKEDAKQQAQHIEYESFGTDKNKKRKNQKSCDRGTNSGPARYCSSHLRKIYKKHIIGDNEESEWCVVSRHHKACCINTNSCNLCHINPDNFMVKTRMINIAEAIASELGGNINNNDDTKYQRRLLSFMLLHIVSDYPGTNKEYTTLRIKVNGQIWIEYFIKITAFSSILKTSAPSGYKYKDRISLGRMIRIQGEKNKDLIFYLTKSENYVDAEKEKERPVVNCVGFWNLTKKAKDGEIRNIIHLNQEQAAHVSFGFLIKNPNNIDSIQVELVCNRNCLSMTNTILPLWIYSKSGNNSMDTMDAMENKSNASPTSPASYGAVQHSPLNLPSIIDYNNNYNNYNNNNHHQSSFISSDNNRCYGSNHGGIHIGLSQTIRYSPLRQPPLNQYNISQQPQEPILSVPPPITTDYRSTTQNVMNFDDNQSQYPGFGMFHDNHPQSMFNDTDSLYLPIPITSMSPSTFSYL